MGFDGGGVEDSKNNADSMWDEERKAFKASDKLFPQDWRLPGCTPEQGQSPSYR